MRKYINQKKLLTKYNVLQILSVAIIFIAIYISFLSINAAPTAGSAVNNGNYTVSVNECWPANSLSNPYVFDNLTLSVGTILTICEVSGEGLYIQVNNNFVNNGTIDVSGKGLGQGVPGWLLSEPGVSINSGTDGMNGTLGGYGGSRASGAFRDTFSGFDGGDGQPGGGGGATLQHGTNGQVGAAGGNGGTDGTTDVFGDPKFGPAGAGGLAGTAGLAGGIVYIRAGVLTNNGQILAEGSNGTNGTAGTDAVPALPVTCNTANNILFSHASNSGANDAGASGNACIEEICTPNPPTPTCQATGTAVCDVSCVLQSGVGTCNIVMIPVADTCSTLCKSGLGSGGKGAGGSGGGGGGGGAIVLKATTLNLGSTSVSAGSGGLGASGGSGAGGDGSIAEDYPSPNTTCTAIAGGGGGSGGSGGNGGNGGNGILIAEALPSNTQCALDAQENCTITTTSCSGGANCCWQPNTYNTPYRFNNLTINAGVTLSQCNSGEGLYIEVKENFINSGVIDVSGKGSAGVPSWVSNAGITSTFTSDHIPQSFGAGADGGTAGQPFLMPQPGQASSGAAGNSGGNGAVLFISARNIENTGSILANGTAGFAGGNGQHASATSWCQAGPVCCVLWPPYFLWDNCGSQGVAINANAGNGGGGGGGGAGGLVFLKAESISSNQIQINGGAAGNGGVGGSGYNLSYWSGSHVCGINYCRDWQNLILPAGTNGNTGGRGSNGYVFMIGGAGTVNSGTISQVGGFPRITTNNTDDNSLSLQSANILSQLVEGIHKGNGWVNRGGAYAISALASGTEVLPGWLTVSSASVSPNISQQYPFLFPIEKLCLDIDNTTVDSCAELHAPPGAMGTPLFLNDELPFFSIDGKIISGSNAIDINDFWQNHLYWNTSSVIQMNDKINLFALEEASGYQDGTHSFNILAQNRGNNIKRANLDFLLDLRAPCEGGSSVFCQVNIVPSGQYNFATNSRYVTVAAVVTDDQGSQIETSKSLELAWRYVYWNPNDPWGSPRETDGSLSVNFPLEFNDPLNVNVRDYSPTVANFAISATGWEEGWYAICARFKDKAGNITTLNYKDLATLPANQKDGIPFGNNPDTLKKALGDITFPDSQSFGYGAKKVCHAVNLDLTAPKAPQNLSITVNDPEQGVITIFGPHNGPSNTQYQFPANGTGSMVAPDMGAYANNLKWTNVNILRLRWDHPVEAPPASPLMSGFYKFSDTYTPGLASGPTGIMTNAESGQVAPIQPDPLLQPLAEPYFDIAYDNLVLGDGCRNLYFWLADAAGNKFNPDGSFDYNTVLLCFDKTKPNTPTKPNFYSLNGVINSGLLNTTAKTLDLSTLSDHNLADNYLQIPVTRKKDAQNNDDQIMLVWDPVEDVVPTGRQASGIDPDNVFKLCWDIDSGADLETCSEIRNNFDTYTASDGSIKYVYIFSSTEMNDTNLPSNIYYFYLVAQDRAGNYSFKSPLQNVIIDNELPCWDFGSNCSLTLDNKVGTIDLNSTVNSISISVGYKNTISANPVLGYLKCGDDLGEQCDLPFLPNGGGIFTRFNITSDDGLKGSGFAPNDNEVVQLGTGIDVWTTDSNNEAVLWFDNTSPTLDGKKSLTSNTSGNLGFSEAKIHLFEGKSPINLYDYNYYTNNFAFYDFNNIAASNVRLLKFNENQGRETVRNIYLRLQDIAGNLSEHENNKVIYQTIILDTYPPRRITNAVGQPPELRQGAVVVMNINENSLGKVTYSSDGLLNWNSDILSHPPVKNPNFKLVYGHPIELSAVTGIRYKKDNPPTSYDDSDSILKNTTAKEIEISADKNYQIFYIWLQDGSGNPNRAAVPGIDNYYTMSNDVSKPCYVDASGIAEYLNTPNEQCRVLQFRMPFDGTPPVFAQNSAPYLQDPMAAIEATYQPRPTIYFKGATDSVSAPWESGLRSVDTYELCYDQTPGGCENSLWISDASGIQSDFSFTPSADLPDGHWYFSVRAYDRAGNVSIIDQNSVKEIIIESQPPCHTAAETCNFSIANNSYSIGQRQVALQLIGNDAVGVEKMAIAEYFESSGQCFSAFFTNTGTMTNPIVQPCTGVPDFSIVEGISPLRPETLINYSNSITGFVLSDGDGTKSIFVRYADTAKNWSVTPLKKNIILDQTPPEAPISVTSNSTGWTNQQSFQISIKLPTNDLSSNGTPFHGIGKIYYKVGQTPLHPADGNSLSINASMYDSVTDTFLVPMQVTQSGVKTVYFWLEDSVGNKSDFNKKSVQLMYDGSAPIPPTSLRIEVQNLRSRPLITWLPATDDDSGVRSISAYELCWGNSPGNCTYSAIKNSNELEHQFSTSDELSFGPWYFTLFVYDSVGNKSTPVQAYEWYLKNAASEFVQKSLASDGSYFVREFPTEINFIGSGEFSKSPVYPGDGKEGIREFKLIYRDDNNMPPLLAQVIIDTNGNGQFEAHEAVSMQQIGNSTDFVVGQQYSVKIPLMFSQSSDGIIRYKFTFTNSLNTAVAGSSGLDPNEVREIRATRYDANFDGIAQVRNNVVRPGTSNPIVVVLKPPANNGTNVSIQVYNRRGQPVKSILNTTPFQQLPENYLYWYADNDSGSKLPSGMYYLKVVMGDQELIKSVVIVR